LNLEIQHAGSIDEPHSRLEAVTAMDCVMNKITGRRKAAKQHTGLLETGLPITFVGETLHGVRCL
jgi:hypothetical protein